MISPDDVDDPAVAQQLLDVFANAWVSGYASAFVNAAQRYGIPAAQLQTMGKEAEHRAQHSMQHVVDDPAARHTLLESIRHVLAGCQGHQPFTGIATVHRRDRPIQDGS